VATPPEFRYGSFFCVPWYFRRSEKVLWKSEVPAVRAKMRGSARRAAGHLSAVGFRPIPAQKWL